jgi:hypothetical protein
VRSVAAGIVTCAAVLSVSLAVTGAARADDASSSSVTVSAKDQDIYLGDAPMPDLKVTVSQTADLVAQAVSVSWTGGKASTLPSGSASSSRSTKARRRWKGA